MEFTHHHLVFLVVSCHYQSESISVLSWLCMWELPHERYVQLNCALKGEGEVPQAEYSVWGSNVPQKTLPFACLLVIYSIPAVALMLLECL